MKGTFVAQQPRMLSGRSFQVCLCTCHVGSYSTTVIPRRCDGQPNILNWQEQICQVLPSEARPGRVAIAPSLWGASTCCGLLRKVHLFRVNVRVKFLDI